MRVSGIVSVPEKRSVTGLSFRHGNSLRQLRPFFVTGDWEDLRRLRTTVKINVSFILFSKDETPDTMKSSGRSPSYVYTGVTPFLVLGSPFLILVGLGESVVSTTLF